jgi:hypothetical protein
MTKARLLPATEIFEFICNENERYIKHLGPDVKRP